ncbi:MAG TPA: arginine--tRNA ligase [Gemmatimonadales bacterium]|nr:arginine--tRNA ligase [Gemmatimonadales bacterium]
MSDQLRSELARIAADLGAPDVTFIVERPRDEGHGDWATNLAMALAKPLKRKPRELADEIVAKLALPGGAIRKTEIAGPGFINFWLAEDALAGHLRTIIAEAGAYGRHTFGLGKRINVEFVSANPTGPLHVGHGRGAALGDGIAALYEWTGHEVTREFYNNDAGVQIDKLGMSLWARVQEAVGRAFEIPEGGYHGEYLKESAQKLLAREGRAFADLPAAEGIKRCRAAALLLMREDQDNDLATFGVRFQVMASEQAVRDAGKVEATLKLLAEKGLSFEEDGALWFRTSAFGDDKDRVLRKQDGNLTYFVPDIAYHIDKHARGFHKAIDLWGADHHGYVPRMRAAMVALGYGAEFFEAEIIQLVKVVRGGEEVRMSKRSGEFVTLRDLIEWVGVDAARYFFLMRRGDSPFTFDIDLARSQTDENPVFYVQMAHARLTGLFRVAGREVQDADPAGATMAGLPAPQDQELLKKLIAFPDIVAGAARAHEPHRVTGYLEELARVAHAWYHHCRVLGEPAAVERSRLVLARAARQVLANGLALLGCSAPDRM